MSSIANKIAQSLRVNLNQVDAAIRLLDEGATVPFIARYRKEATQGLDDSQLRQLAAELSYQRELGERRQVILKSIAEQEKLTPELEKTINQAETKTRLEDLYLPYKPKRRSKAQAAKEAGLEPLAHALLQNPELNPQETARQYLNQEHQIDDEQLALEGAGHILMEQFTENADLLEQAREYLWNNAVLQSKVAPGQENAGKKYSDYFEYAEPINKIPSHRALALFRGRRENILQLQLTLSDNEEYGQRLINQHFSINHQGRAADDWLAQLVNKAWKIKIFTKLELELMTRLRESAEQAAIQVFAANLRDLLLAAPAGEKITIGLDPGIRTGVKAVVVDATGKLLDFTTIYPLPPQNEWHQSIMELAKLATKYNADLISIGNGTGSRETERLVSELTKMYPDLNLSKIVVNEAGASVYSASELASKEFPDLDVSLRGAASIARRLQDPLAELVKIEPKAIGVGQYQHDVNQHRLAKSLNDVVEDCVNAVGVDVNTASAPLLKRISGLNETLAKNIVEFRDTHGAFTNREQLKSVARMGEKSYQQAAGFLRIMNGDNLLDSSCVHPESYPIVEKILASTQQAIPNIIGNSDFLKSINAHEYVDEQHGLPTITDILKELEKPGRDPRPEFKTVRFKEGIEEISHLEEGMALQGVVTNVTDFGAFIDIGVHQDGLVHISEMTNKFIKDPRQLVKANDIVSVKVLEVDITRKRISLSMKLSDDKPASNKPAPKQAEKKHQVKNQMAKPMSKTKNKPKPVVKPVVNSAMADAFAKLTKGK